jgi:hypothetical protein
MNIILKNLNWIVLLLVITQTVNAQNTNIHPLLKVEELGKILPIKEVIEEKGNYILKWEFDENQKLRTYNQTYHPQSPFGNSDKCYYYMDTHYKSVHGFKNKSYISIQPVNIEYNTYYPIQEIDSFGKQGELISQKLVNGLEDTLAFFFYHYNNDQRLTSYNVKSVHPSCAKSKINKETKWNYIYIELSENGYYKSYLKLQDLDTISLQRYTSDGITMCYETKNCNVISKDSTVVYHEIIKSISNFMKTHSLTIERITKSPQYKKHVETIFDEKSRPILSKFYPTNQLYNEQEKRFIYNDDGSLTEETWWMSFNSKQSKQQLKLKKVNASLDEFPPLVFSIYKYDKDGKLLTSTTVDNALIKKDLAKVLKGKLLKNNTPYRYFDYDTPKFFSIYEYNKEGLLLHEYSLSNEKQGYFCDIRKLEYQKDSIVETEFEYRAKKKLSFNDVLEILDDVDTTNLKFYEKIISSYNNISGKKDEVLNTILHLNIIRSDNTCEDCNYDCDDKNSTCDINGQLIKYKNQTYEYDNKGALILLKDKHGLVLKRKYQYYE